MKGRKFILYLSATAISLFVALGLWYVLVRPEQSFLPPLAQGLPLEFQEANNVFKGRINDTFSIGSSQAVLVQRLRAEGFEQHGPFRNTPGRSALHSAIFERPGFPCKLTWSVYWSAEDDKLTSVTSSYTGTCL